jgi:hypothetical protein
MKTLNDFDKDYLDKLSMKFTSRILLAYYIGKDTDFTFGKEYELPHTFRMEQHYQSIGPVVGDDKWFYVFMITNDRGIDTRVFGNEFCLYDEYIKIMRDNKINQILE